MGLREATAALQQQQRQAQGDHTRRIMIAAYRKAPTPELLADIQRLDAERRARGEVIAADYDVHGQLVPPGPVTAQSPDAIQLKVNEIERQLAGLKAHLANFPVSLH